MKALFIISALFIASMSYASECTMTFKKLNKCVEFKFDEAPVVSKYIKAKFFFFDPQVESVKVDPELNVKVELFMPMMGHGSRPVFVTKNTDLNFIADKLYFMMDGFWEVRMKLIDNNNKVIDEAKMELNL